MRHTSSRLAGILLVVFPTVVYGGVSLSGLLIDSQSGYIAQAGVLLILSLVVLHYVDQVVLPDHLKGFVRHAIPMAALLLPMAFFPSVLSPTASEPNRLIDLAFLGAVSLAAGLITLSVGLLRRPRKSSDGSSLKGDRDDIEQEAQR